jgi:hypothetical protein
MRYLLDTDHISFLQRRSGTEHTRLVIRMGQYSPADFALSIVSLHEQVLGAHDFINRARARCDSVDIICCLKFSRVLHQPPFYRLILNRLRSLMSCEGKEFEFLPWI